MEHAVAEMVLNFRHIYRGEEILLNISLSPGQTRMKVEEWEFAWEFSQLSCKHEQELHESWEASGLYEGFLNFHASIKPE